MHKLRLSTASLSIVFALALAAWEIYFFFFAHLFAKLEGTVGLFTPNRLGFNLAWLILVYLTYQLISIPFALPASRGRFVGVLDGMASIVPFAVVLVVMFGRPALLDTGARWEAAFLLLFTTGVDLFGGYAFNIALSRRTFDVSPTGV